MDRLSSRLKERVATALVLTLLAAFPNPASAMDEAATEARLAALQKQMAAMQRELQTLRRRPAPTAVAEARSATGPGGSRLTRRTQALQGIPGSEPRTPAFVQAETVCEGNAMPLGHVCFTPGGFVELAGFYRTPNQAADIASDFAGIPFRNSFQAREGEFRFSARQSRLSGLVTAMIDPSLKASGYAEFDFLGAGVTSNSRESNSYVPRIRQVWAALDQSEWGVHVLAGQAFSLATTNLSGITPLKEQIPLTIDAQYVPGFNWARTPQIRVSKDLGQGLWAAASLESPQSVLPPSPFTVPAGINLNNSGDAGGLNNSTTTYSNSEAPDILAKLAWEPGWGHYELKGVGRLFSDRLVGKTDTEAGYGIGGAATLPIVKDYADLQLSGLAGRGIGRYGSAQLPDFALRADGSVAAVPMFQLLAGLVGHVQPGTDVYAYAGWEHAERTGSLSLAGYGSPNLVVTGCDVEGSAAALCQAESRDIRQVTGGFWHDLYKGSYGRLVAGAQASYTTRDAFRGAAGVAPSTHMVVGLASLRYYPF
ncbi:hypothetical protein [Methylobacterium sp. WL9]|uniref:hypothetical protein n=1 Tax=Methylobacterium sp. WL9 TaxID=2603898 RepID=UPI0011CA44BF|nr:hypothetical protein [Methylobacterium sp. WL9]TXN22853.1 hypothetical protein FV217_09020 [Methylobacterium sp. WL9]